ncbi:MAG: NAD(P)-dependent alcohol dehydrogenase [Proteobacteria bacterium]|nr:MAG: NAD(P)-dependent alcohol dehydrogenase [Pseudomonadota bacterium]
MSNKLDKPFPAKGLAVFQKGGRFDPFAFDRRALRADDVAVKIHYAGICHSDLHAVRDNWAGEFPIVPGHEIMGEVTGIGQDVEDFKVGDSVLIGTIVDSCRTCDPCERYIEPYCREFPTLTYDGIDRIDKTRTRGGYSDFYVSDKRFVHHLPKGLDPARAAPLLCAGITVYSPLKHWEIGPGHTIAVVGIGGLGHLAVKFARALGAHVVAITRTQAKADEALKLGAHETVLSTDAEAMERQAYRFDFILDTVSTRYPMDPIIKALKLDGTLCSLGIPDSFDFTPVLLTMGRRRLTSSGVGGTKETKEMLAFCAKHSIEPDVEIVHPSKLDETFDRLAQGDVRYRFVMDLRSGI